MTKDGRPSLINDMRLFVGESSTSSSYLKDQEDAVAFGRRITWLLNSEGFCLGAFPALYVLFTPSMEPGSVQATDKGGDWWQRYAYVGVTNDFPNIPDAYDKATRGIVDALIAMRPDLEEIIRFADATVREHGERLRFLLKRREMAKVCVEISFNIAVWPEPSYLFIAHIDKVDAIYREADPIALGSYLEGFDLVSGIRIEDASNLKKVLIRAPVSKVVKRK
jgi:hypothetical protein